MKKLLTLTATFLIAVCTTLMIDHNGFSHQTENHVHVEECQVVCVFFFFYVS